MDKALITGLILAGGEGRRMGGQDKGWVVYRERPLIEHVIERLRPQIGERLIISANRSLTRYQALGFDVVSDEQNSFEGPLAGILSGLRSCQTPYLLCVPCDVPWLPLDLAQRLYETIQHDAADVAYVTRFESSQGQTEDLHPGKRPLSTNSRDGLCAEPLFCLISKSLESNLREWMQTGERKVMNWMKAQSAVTVVYDEKDSACFVNVNHTEQLSD